MSRIQGTVCSWHITGDEQTACLPFATTTEYTQKLFDSRDFGSVYYENYTDLPVVEWAVPQENKQFKGLILYI